MHSKPTKPSRPAGTPPHKEGKPQGVKGGLTAGLAAGLGAGSIVALGWLQIAGYLLGSPSLMGLGFVSAASPLPLVFSHFRGAEPFSARYDLSWESKEGQQGTRRVDAAEYAKLEGPYNLRNVYGAVFAAGPVFQDKPQEALLWETVMRRAFCAPGFLVETFQLPRPLRSIQLDVSPRGRGLTNNWSKKVDCQL